MAASIDEPAKNLLAHSRLQRDDIIGDVVDREHETEVLRGVIAADPLGLGAWAVGTREIIISTGDPHLGLGVGVVAPVLAGAEAGRGCRCCAECGCGEDEGGWMHCGDVSEYCWRSEQMNALDGRREEEQFS